jgi:hypothetical protein
VSGLPDIHIVIVDINIDTGLETAAEPGNPQWRLARSASFSEETRRLEKAFAREASGPAA